MSLKGADKSPLLIPLRSSPSIIATFLPIFAASLQVVDFCINQPPLESAIQSTLNPEVVKAKATPQEYAPAPAQTAATKTTAVKPKAARKPAVATAKAARPNRSKTKLVKMLRKADIQV